MKIAMAVRGLMQLSRLLSNFDTKCGDADGRIESWLDGGSRYFCT